MEKKKRALADLDHPPFLPGVGDVIIWALLNAGSVALSPIATTLIFSSLRNPLVCAAVMAVLPSPGAEPREMTGAEACAVLTATILCVVSQAAAGVLALALGRHRLLLAYAALVATAADHCNLSYILFLVAPGGLSFWTGVVLAVAIFIFGVVDMLCFWGLIVRGGEE